MSLQWLANFLSERTQQVKAGSTLFIMCDVPSNVMQGAILVPVLFKILTDSLPHVVKLQTTVAFANDLKLIACTSAVTQQDVQNDVNTIFDCAEQHNMPPSDDKCNVLHCGKYQWNRAYTLKGKQLATTTFITAFGVNKSFSLHYY
jgi:hypothetical protein